MLCLCATHCQSCHCRPTIGIQPSLHALQDVFSLGCVIAELFLEGRALFDLSKVRSITAAYWASWRVQAYLVRLQM